MILKSIDHIARKQITFAAPQTYIPIKDALELASELAAETRRLDWMLSASGEQLNALDQWDRDNIDDAIDREDAE